VIEKDNDAERDAWEFAAVQHSLARQLPLFAICKGVQLLNVALGGTLHLDIRGHNLPAQKNNDVQPLRCDRRARHHYAKVNSSHHQAIDRLGDGLAVEAWCADDGIVEQIRRRQDAFVLGVQYHPERGNIYGGLFEDFFEQVMACAKRRT
jgi:putative glutamine amidotransferase